MRCLIFGLLGAAVPTLATVDAVLNAVATVLLVCGLVLIKRGHEQWHKRIMLCAFVVSSVFLACYLTYHLTTPSTKFQGQGVIRPIYFSILISHVLLAITVPVLAIRTIYLGLKDRRAEHRKAARWTFPIWLYVSVTGVVVYLMLYHLYAAGS